MIQIHSTPPKNLIAEFPVIMSKESKDLATYLEYWNNQLDSNEFFRFLQGASYDLFDFVNVHDLFHILTTNILLPIDHFGFTEFFALYLHNATEIYAQMPAPTLQGNLVLERPITHPWFDLKNQYNNHADNSEKLAKYGNASAAKDLIYLLNFSEKELKSTYKILNYIALKTYHLYSLNSKNQQTTVWIPNTDVFKQICINIKQAIFEISQTKPNFWVRDSIYPNAGDLSNLTARITRILNYYGFTDANVASLYLGLNSEV